MEITTNNTSELKFKETFEEKLSEYEVHHLAQIKFNQNNDLETVISTKSEMTDQLTDTGNDEGVSKIYDSNFESRIVTPHKTAIIKNFGNPRGEQNKNHYLIFQQALKPLLIWGQIWGLNPVLGIFAKEASKIRFQTDSLRFWYSITVCILQAIVAMFCLNSFLRSNFTISGMSSLCFHGSTSVVTLLCIKIATKWPNLVQEVSSTGLDVNLRIKLKCKMAFALLLAIAFVEHVLSVIAAVALIQDCYPEKEIYRSYIENSYFFIFDMGMPYHFTVGIFLQFITYSCTVNWSYSDKLVICISIYLTSVIEEINKKIRVASNDKEFSSSSWRALREAYTRASRLVRVFDDVINTIVFVGFSTNLFFVCLQLFYVLSYGIQGADEKCPNFPSGLLGGYEHSIYYSFSLLTVVVRSLSVALISSNVHSASIASALSLYEVSSTDYCQEVQRFIEQVHGDTVALSGYEFFYMTRDIVLSVAGTIITYELVLLQFRGESMVKYEPTLAVEYLNYSTW